MSKLFEISGDLESYFRKSKVRKSVDHIIHNKKDDKWLDLSLSALSPSSNIDEILNYKEAWSSAKKIQADYYEFMARLWDHTWAKALEHDNFMPRTLPNKTKKPILEPKSFIGVENNWKERQWEIEYKVSAIKYNQLWLYLSESENGEEISLWMQFGKKDFSNCGNIENPDLNFWKFDCDEDEKETEGHFILKRNINFWNAEEKKLENTMYEMADFITEVFNLNS